jgi:hypothetical protein
MRMSLGMMVWIVLLPCLCQADGIPALRAQNVKILMQVAAGGKVLVTEHYSLAGGPPSFGFVIMSDSCRRLDDFTLKADGTPVGLSRKEDRMWLHLDPASTTHAAAYDLSYAIEPFAGNDRRDADIPLLMPDRAIFAATGTGLDLIHLSVEQTSGAIDGIILPQMARAPDGDHWTAQLAAVPTVIRVKWSGSGVPCDQAALRNDPTGPFFRNLWSFLALLVTWVALYLLWAYRKTEIV